MNIQIKATNFELTDAINNYLYEKIGSIEHILPQNSDAIKIQIEVGKPSLHHNKGPIFYTEANLSMGGMLMRATAEHDDLYAAVDIVKDELMRQILKFKDKKVSERRHGNIE